MSVRLDDLVNFLEEAEQEEKERAKSARSKVKKLSKAESLDEAYRRILDTKLTNAEVAVVNLVFNKLKDGSLSRLKEGRLSKKEVFELYQVYQENEKEAKQRHVIETRPDNYWVIQDYDTLVKFEKMLFQEQITAWDTETTGLDLFNDKVVGYSAYLPKHDVAVYVPFGHTTGQLQVSEDAALSIAKRYLENTEYKTIFHHFKYDAHLLLNHGIHVKNAWWDTQICSKILNEHEESHRLKDLYAKYILKKPDASIQFEDLFDDHKIYDKDVVLSGIYAAGDAYKTYKLYEFQKPFIDSRDNLKTVWYQIEQKLLPVDLHMERTGFCVDLERIEKLKAEFTPKLKEAEQQLIEAFNIDDAFLRRMSAKLGREITEFNVNSPEQLAYLIYDELGIDPDFGLKFKEKSRSTASKVLDALCNDYEQLEPLLTYRQLNKIVTTYLKKIPEAMEPKTGRLHSRFNNGAGEDGNTGAATGRYSSSAYVSGKHSATGNVAKGTNLQNLPSKGLGLEVRKCLVPDDGWIFIASDLSQIEPRTIAHILYTEYGDGGMRQLYLDGVDLYTRMAMQTFNLPEEYCVDKAYDPSNSFQPRKLMKTGMLAFLYGSSESSFARDMKVSPEVAKRFFDGMLEAFPGLKKFREDTIRKMLYRGDIAYAEDLWGRKRRFPDYRKNKAELEQLEKIPFKKMTEEQRIRRRQLWSACARDERMAVNHRVQASAAGVIKLIMAEFYKELVVPRSYKLVCSIHDEIVLSVPKKDLTPALIDEVNRIMTETVKISVPLKCDTVIMERFGDEVVPEKWDFERCCPMSA